MPLKPPLFYRLARAVIRAVVPLYGGIQVSGAENIPADGPVILAPNHRAHVDPPYLALICPRQIYFMGKEELFHVPILRQIITRVGAFPVRRGAADRAALRHAVDLLKAGGVVLIFPEGTRSEDGRLGTAEKGFALIARQANAVIVPVAIEGTERMLPKGAKFIRRSRVRVTIGKPLTTQGILDAHPHAGKESLEIIGAATMSAIADLLHRPG